MTKVINIYCDESCHLEHDHQPIMLFGAVWCPREDVRQNIVALRKLKEKHHARGELKWSKVSDSRKTFFIDLVDLFFLSFNLNFRCLIVKGRWDAVKKLNNFWMPAFDILIKKATKLSKNVPFPCSSFRLKMRE